MNQNIKDQINRLQQKYSSGDESVLSDLAALLIQAGKARCCATNLDPTAAEDIVMEVVIRFLEKEIMDRYHTNFLGFFYTALHNQMVSYYRSKKNQATIDITNLTAEDATSEQQENQILAMSVQRARSNSPEAQLIRQSMVEDLKAILSQLPDKASRVYRLAFYEDKKQHEIAEILGIAPGTVADILSARWRDKHLRPALEQLGWDEAMVASIFERIDVCLKRVSKKRRPTGVSMIKEVRSDYR